MIKKLLMKIARSILQQVMNQINQIVQETLDSVLNPVEAIMQEIGGGDTWRGEGANAFMDEVQSILIPDVNSLMESSLKGINSIATAEQIMTQAENEVNGLIDTWADTVSGIY